MHTLVARLAFVWIAMTLFNGCGISQIPALEKEAQTASLELKLAYQEYFEGIRLLLASKVGRQAIGNQMELLQSRFRVAEKSVDDLRDPFKSLYFSHFEASTGSLKDMLAPWVDNRAHMGPEWARLRTSIVRVVQARRRYAEAVQALGARMKKFPIGWISRHLLGAKDRETFYFPSRETPLANKPFY